jgi:hypothetical protein
MRKLAMDEVEAGFEALVARIGTREKEKEALSEELRQKDALLLARMAKSAKPLISRIGLDMLERGKQDTKGELYDTVFFRKKMIVLGKTEPVGERPDNPQKKVDDQFCVFSEDGKFYELLYSFDGFLVDSYLRLITPEQVMARYGIDVMVLLYHALHDYLEGEEELIKSLRLVLTYIYPEKMKK